MLACCSVSIYSHSGHNWALISDHKSDLTAPQSAFRLLLETAADRIDSNLQQKCNLVSEMIVAAVCRSLENRKHLEDTFDDGK